MRTVRLLAAALLASALAAPAAMAQTDTDVAGHFDFHLRGVFVSPEASIHAEEGGTKLPLTGSSISDSFVPEVDATYYVTNHIGVEVIAATTQHSPNVTLGGSKLDLGSVWLLPPTVTAKYSFDPNGAIRPYIGAGVNYTLFYDPKSGALPDTKYGNSWGTALQAGVDVPVSGPYFLNLDVKQLFLNDSVKAVGGVVRAHAIINPLLVGVGVGIRL
jgi:outer membrane protein